MSAVSFFSLTGGTSATQGSTVPAGGRSTATEADGTVRAEFSGILAVFAAEAAAEPPRTPTTTLGAWSLEASGDGYGDDGPDGSAVNGERGGDRSASGTPAREADKAPRGTDPLQAATGVQSQVRTQVPVPTQAPTQTQAPTPTQVPAAVPTQAPTPTRVPGPSSVDPRERRHVQGAAHTPVPAPRVEGTPGRAADSAPGSASVSASAAAAVSGSAPGSAPAAGPADGPALHSGPSGTATVLWAPGSAPGVGEGPAHEGAESSASSVEGSAPGAAEGPAPAAAGNSAAGAAEVDGGDGLQVREGAAPPLSARSDEATPLPVAWTRDLGVTARVDAAGGGQDAVDATTAVRALRDDPRLDGLHPEMRSKVERVVERMAALGHSVEIVEGYRSPQRQQDLYAQGRTRPGPVVTWTTDSRHSQGLAVDLRVNGTWDDPAAYARLQQVARQEGLSTLGPRDPGHLELSLDASAAEAAGPPAEGPEEPGSTTSGRSRDGVARSARVADVAQVAHVARVARPGHGTARADDVEIPRAPAAVAEPELTPPRPDHSTPDFRSLEPDGQQVVDGRVADAGRVAPPSTAPAQATSGAVAPGPAAPVTGPDPMSGVERVLEIQDAMESLSPTRVSVRLDGTAGPIEQLRVSLADRALDAWMGVRDSGSVDRMRAGMDELYRALEGRGYDPGILSVSATAASDAPTLESALASRGDAAAGVLRTFIDAVAATGSARQSGTDSGQQNPTRDAPDGRTQQDRSGGSRRDDTRRNQK